MNSNETENLYKNHKKNAKHDTAKQFYFSCNAKWKILLMYKWKCNKTNGGGSGVGDFMWI